MVAGRGRGGAPSGIRLGRGVLPCLLRGSAHGRRSVVRGRDRACRGALGVLRGARGGARVLAVPACGAPGGAGPYRGGGRVARWPGAPRGRGPALGRDLPGPGRARPGTRPARTDRGRRGTRRDPRGPPARPARRDLPGPRRLERGHADRRPAHRDRHQPSELVRHRLGRVGPRNALHRGRGGDRRVSEPGAGSPARSPDRFRPGGPAGGGRPRAPAAGQRAGVELVGRRRGPRPRGPHGLQRPRRPPGVRCRPLGSAFARGRLPTTGSRGGHPHTARVRGPGPHRAGAHQPRDRRAALPQFPHRRAPRQPRPREAGSPAAAPRPPLTPPRRRRLGARRRCFHRCSARGSSECSRSVSDSHQEHTP